MTASLPVLSDSRRLRFSAFTLFYVAQGIPIGLLDIAMPAWLAEQGYSPLQIGSYVAVVGLPWAFKLVAGPFMDRFGIPAMGRRRPWVMLAQTGLMCMLAVLALVPEPSSQLLLITAVGIAVNFFAATQDVAVDGMAIDVLPVLERGRANAFMAFGQVIGVAGMGALSGYLLSRFGLGLTALMGSLIVALILGLVVLVRERPGERLLPWSEGIAHPEAKALAPDLRGLFADLKRALVLPMSLVITAAVFIVRVAMGMFLACVPVFTVQELGYSAATYTEAYGVLVGLAAFAGIAIGPLVDKVGAKRVMLAALMIGAALHFTFAGLESFWVSGVFVLGMMAVYLFVEQVIFISLIAQYMNLTWHKVAATQFAVYMALANLGRSSGSALFATLSLSIDYADMFRIIGGLMVVSALIMWMFSERRHLESIAALESPKLRVPVEVVGHGEAS